MRTYLRIDMRHLLVYRFVILNVLALAIVAALAWSGLLFPIYEADSSYLTFAITGLFVLAWSRSFVEVIKLSRLINEAKLNGRYPAASPIDAEKAQLKTEWLDQMSEWLVALGLLGTVIGIAMALSGIDQDSVGNANGAQSAVGALMAGMRVAINTTILGAAFALWHEFDMRMLGTARGCYWLDRIKAGGLR